MKLLLLILPLLSTCFAYVTYEHYKVYRVYLENAEKVKTFQQINKQLPNLDIWKENVEENSVDVMVEPKDQSKFISLLNTHKIQQELYVDDVQKLIEESLDDGFTVRSAGEFNWTSFHPYEQITEWLVSLPQQYPNIVSNFTLGRSHHGVDIVGVRVVLNPNTTKVAIIEAGVHAREWIGPATATYILNSFLTTTNQRIRAAAESMIWYFVPVFNPDGYNRTFYEDRLHRKNLQIVNGSNCTIYSGGSGIGTDLNRNFDYRWMEAGGASSNPCSSSFAGPEPFSAPETLAAKALVDQVAENLELYLSFHSAAQLILFPYGHTTDPIDNYYEHYTIARMAADELRRYNGTEYNVGNTAEAIYVATGTSIDWVKGTYGTRLAYCYELRDRIRYGFLLPPEQIRDTGEETLNSLVVLIEQLQRMDLVTFTRSSSQDNRATQYMILTYFLFSVLVKCLTN